MSTPLAPSVQTTAGFLPPAAAADAAARPADPNSAHRLLPDCVLHNVLALLVVRDVFELGACSRSFQNGALRTPHLNACVGRPAPDGVFTLHRVLARFQNSGSTLYVGDMAGIPTRIRNARPRRSSARPVRTNTSFRAVRAPRSV